MKLVASSELSFNAIGKEIVAAFGRVKAVVSYVKADDGKFVIACMRGAVYAIGTSTDAMACIKIKDAESVSDGTIAIDADLLCGVVKGRGALQFAVQGKLKITETKGRYNAQVEPLDFDDKDIALLQQYLTPNKSAGLSPEQIAIMKAGVKQVALQNFFSEEELLALIDIREKRIVISCFDPYHLAEYSYKSKNAVTLRMALPVKAFELIDKFIGTTKATFESANGRLRVNGPDFLLSIPETQAEDTMYATTGLYKKLLKNPVSSFVFDTDAVGSVENMFALVEKDTKMTMKIGSREIGIEVSTPRGSVSDSFKTKVEGDSLDIHVNPRIFMDLFRKVKDKKTIPLSLYHVRGAASSFAFEVESDKATLVLISSFETEGKHEED